jgi:hypothetical protein
MFSQFVNFSNFFVLDEIEGQEALAIIEENPTNYGVWDRVLDPASAKVRVEQKIKSKLSSQQVIENEIKNLELSERKAKELLEDGEVCKEKPAADEVKEQPFRNLVETGKYLHENDLKWCKTYTKYAEKDIIKWFKRFRALCQRGNMTKDKLDIVYHKLFVGGNSDFFSEQVSCNP